MSTGIITTAIVLIVGYAIVSRVIGLAFRLAIPLILIMVLGGAGLLSGFMPDREAERYPAEQSMPYEQAQHRSGGNLGDLRLRDIADMAVDAARSILQGSLALLNGISEPEPRWTEQPQPLRRSEGYEEPPHSDDAPYRGEGRRGW